MKATVVRYQTKPERAAENQGEILRIPQKLSAGDRCRVRHRLCLPHRAARGSRYCGRTGVTVNAAVLPICLVPLDAVLNSST